MIARTLRVASLTVAFFGFWYATAALFADTPDKATLPGVVCAVAIFGYFTVDYLQWERDRRRQQTWKDMWARRDREAGL